MIVKKTAEEVIVTYIKITVFMGGGRGKPRKLKLEMLFGLDISRASDKPR
jgi:hypothetical protein